MLYINVEVYLYLLSTYYAHILSSTGPMNFITNDPDHIEVLESKLTSNTTDVYSFNGKLI